MGDENCWLAAAQGKIKTHQRVIIHLKRCRRVVIADRIFIYKYFFFFKYFSGVCCIRFFFEFLLKYEIRYSIYRLVASPYPSPWTG